MTPDEIRNARRQLGLSVVQFAEALGVKPLTARRWEMDASRNSYRAPAASVVAHIETMLRSAQSPEIVPNDVRGLFADTQRGES